MDQQITAGRLATLAKAIVAGVLLGEVWHLSVTLAAPLYPYIDQRGAYGLALLYSTVCVAVLAAYLHVRSATAHFRRLARSGRIDILAMLLLGIGISASFDGIGSDQYRAFVAPLTPLQVLVITVVPVAVGLCLILNSAWTLMRRTRASKPPFFVSDSEQTSAKDDLLSLAGDAERFAERVLNGGAPDSVVFGIDAPWGIGKSTFVNFCIEYWAEKHESEVIVYKFNLLRYEDTSQLLEKFVDGLIRSIQKNIFIPEIRPLISKYSRFIGGRGGISQFGVSWEPATYTVDDAFEDLASVLDRLDKKIIVIVDDLDRVDLVTIKNVLFAIKKSFTLPNISYVLCYDTENIATTTGEGTLRVREFLEKFINVKVSLFLHPDTLADYITKHFKRALQNNLQLDPDTVERIKDAVSGIVEIYKSNEYSLYQEFLGDIRKLKRLINTLVLFEIEKTDFMNSDFDKRDLVHLLLIYMNFPTIFRKIYNTETGGKRGFFSLVTHYDKGYPETDDERKARGSFSEGHYKNSRYYSAFVEGLPVPQRTLLDRVFSASVRLEDTTVGRVPEANRNALACFNGDFTGGGSRNLERYLDLIVKLSKPRKRDQYRFYVNAKDKLLKGVAIDELLSAPDFAFSESETSRQQFWRIVVNSASEFGAGLGQQLIAYLLDHIDEYSALLHDQLGDGIRDDIVLHLLKLLDSVGWTDASGRRHDNTPENIAAIAEWVFGEGKYQTRGIVDKLISENRGILGLFDLMLFRLYCCADRGSSFFNLQRSLSLHGDPAAPTTGDTRVIVVHEMRELSQLIFKKVESLYIKPRQNLLELIDQVPLEALAGRYMPFVNRSVASGNISTTDLDQAARRARTRLKAFITYQLANVQVSQGIGCGYYDKEGREDKKGIAKSMNDYLFQCFEPGDDHRGYECFLDYLLIGFESTFGRSADTTYIPTIEGFTKVLDQRRLADYWKSNSTKIRGLNLDQKDKTVVTGNYIAHYREDLRSLYEVLDRLVTDPANLTEAQR